MVTMVDRSALCVQHFEIRLFCLLKAHVSTQFRACLLAIGQGAYDREPNIETGTRTQKATATSGTVAKHGRSSRGCETCNALLLVFSSIMQRDTPGPQRDRWRELLLALLLGCIDVLFHVPVTRRDLPVLHGRVSSGMSRCAPRDDIDPLHATVAGKRRL
jgi:hypothetical protein